MVDHDRSRRRYGKADDELVGWFSAAIGVRAQNLDSRGGGFNSHAMHEGRLKAMAWLQGRVGAREWFDRVAATLAELPLEHRRVVVAVYTPHGSPTWLADALSTPWGGGSLVVLAGALPRASLAAADRREGATVLDWLAARGRRANDPLLRALREDGEALRMLALTAYEPLRQARVKAEQAQERAEVERRAAENRERYARLSGLSARRARERMDRRLRVEHKNRSVPVVGRP